MARIRTIKPEFFTSLAIAGLTPVERLTFIGLWTYVDDEGRGVNEPNLVKAAIFPLDAHIDAQSCAKAVQTLSTKGLIATYAVDGKPLMVITNWLEHQRISHPTPSKLPAPPVHRPRKPSRKIPEPSGNIPETSGDDLEPSVSAHETLRPERNREQGREQGRENPPNPPLNGLRPVPSYHPPTPLMRGAS